MCKFTTEILSLGSYFLMQIIPRTKKKTVYLNNVLWLIN